MVGTSKVTTRMHDLSMNPKSLDGVKQVLPNPGITASAKRRVHSSRRLKVVFLLVIVVILLIGGYLYHRHQESNLKGLPELVRVEDEVSKLYLLPTNEVPALATVTNSSKLTTPFLRLSK